MAERNLPNGGRGYPIPVDVVIGENGKSGAKG